VTSGTTVASKTTIKAFNQRVKLRPIAGQHKLWAFGFHRHTGGNLPDRERKSSRNAAEQKLDYSGTFHPSKPWPFLSLAESNDAAL
jgi:hypothetical protein